MAGHQPHSIPWEDLTSNLEWVAASPCHENGTNLHPRFKANQGKKLTRFVNAFARNVDEQATRARREYPEEYDPPDNNDIILDDDVVRRITPAVHRMRLDWDWNENDFDPPDKAYHGTPAICRHRGAESAACGCPVPYEERRASAFLRQYSSNDCYCFFVENQDAYFNIEVVKTLLMHGEMDPILRVCCHPAVDLESWWEMRQCMCMESDIGWDVVCKMALRAYICLNVARNFPETRGPSLPAAVAEERDYRRAKFYQYTIRQCTLSGGTSEAATYPHRVFFGIERGQFDKMAMPRDQPDSPFDAVIPYKCPLGLMPIDEFLAREELVGYQPHASDIPAVLRMLCHKGLPAEVAMEIMGLADYVPKRMLRRAHDPLHEDNSAELARYLDECWRTLICCEMMGKALGMDIDWKEMVTNCIVELWGCNQCTRKKWLKYVHNADKRDGYVFV